MPLPLTEKPITFADDEDAVQLKVVFRTFDVGVKFAFNPEQIVCVNIALVMVGIGSTVTAKLTGVPAHASTGLEGKIT